MPQRDHYIVGTEVPVPGGAHEDLQDLAITRVEDLVKTIEIQREVFEARGLQGPAQPTRGILLRTFFVKPNSAQLER